MGGMRLKSLDVAEVREFLTRNLHWRVLDVSPLSLSRGRGGDTAWRKSSLRC